MSQDKAVHIYQHFKKDEQLFIDKCLEWKQRVEDTYTPYLTPFLTPREQLISQSLFSKQDVVHIHFFGGFVGSEKVRAYLTIEETITLDAFDLAAYNIVYPKKFALLKHHQILGSLLGSGLKRAYIGDIVTNGCDWHVILAKQVGQYAQQNVQKIGSITTRLEQISMDKVLTPLEQSVDVYETVSSLRIDTLIAKVFGLSRQKAKELVERGDVSMNWKEEKRTTIEMAEQDVLSIRRYGRVMLWQINGLSKQSKVKVHLKVLKNHCK